LVKVLSLLLKSVEARHGQMTQKRARRVDDKERMRAAAYLDRTDADNAELGS
jgi:hypothetical protein